MTVFLSACHPVAQPGQVLKVGMMTLATSVVQPEGTTPTGKAGDSQAHGILDAIKYINTELDGAWGYPIEVVVAEESFEPSVMKAILEKFMNEGCLMFTTFSPIAMSAAMETANEAEFPGLSYRSFPSLYRPPQHIYVQRPDFGDAWVAFTKYYKENIWKEKRQPRMALHILDADVGLAVRDAAWAMFEELGVEIVATEEHVLGTTSERESLARIKAKDPDILYIASTGPTAVILKDAYDLGMFSDTVIAIADSGIDTLIKTADTNIVEGIYCVASQVSWGDDVPGMAKMMEYVRKYHPEDEDNVFYMSGWVQSLVMAETLELAVKNAGYVVLAKGGIESWRVMETLGIQKLKNFDIGGFQGRASYTQGDNRLTKSVRVIQIKNGKITPVSDWVETPMIKYEEFPWFQTK
jgi:branched-chain amino acid transport system substrate-binding protein